MGRLSLFGLAKRSQVELQSKSEKPLGRYFPEIVAAMSELKSTHFILDGEIVVPIAGRLDFDQLLQTDSPGGKQNPQTDARASRPIFIAFDLLADERGRSLLNTPLRERRQLLEAFSERNFAVRWKVFNYRLQQRNWSKPGVGSNQPEETLMVYRQTT